MSQGLLSECSTRLQSRRLEAGDAWLLWFPLAPPSPSLIRRLTCREVLMLKWQWWITFTRRELGLFAATFVMRLLALFLSHYFLFLFSGRMEERQAMPGDFNQYGVKLQVLVSQQFRNSQHQKTKRDPPPPTGEGLQRVRVWDQHAHADKLLQQSYKSLKWFEGDPFLWRTDTSATESGQGQTKEPSWVLQSIPHPSFCLGVYIRAIKHIGSMIYTFCIISGFSISVNIQQHDKVPSIYAGCGLSIYIFLSLFFHSKQELICKTKSCDKRWRGINILVSGFYVSRELPQSFKSKYS